MSEFITDNIGIILLALSYSVLALGVKCWIARYEAEYEHFDNLRRDSEEYTDDDNYKDMRG